MACDLCSAVVFVYFRFCVFDISLLHSDDEILVAEMSEYNSAILTKSYADTVLAMSYSTSFPMFTCLSKVTQR